MIAGGLRALSAASAITSAGGRERGRKPALPTRPTQPRPRKRRGFFLPAFCLALLVTRVPTKRRGFAATRMPDHVCPLMVESGRSLRRVPDVRSWWEADRLLSGGGWRQPTGGSHRLSRKRWSIGKVSRRASFALLPLPIPRNRFRSPRYAISH